ncbi:MAG: hypothetical protein ACM3Q2_12935 [Syntrophothermus sp.]
MKKALKLFLLISLIFICGCSRTFTIVKDDSPINRQNIKILNFSCRSGGSYIYLKNSDTLKATSLIFANDSITIFSEFPENLRILPMGDVRKIVTRDGAGSFILGMGMGVVSAILGLIIVAPSLPEGPTAGPPTALVVGPSVGLIVGFTAGEIIGVDKVFTFSE